MRSGEILFLSALIICLSCAQDKNPLESPPVAAGDGYFVIKTEKTDFSWELGESSYYVQVNGSIRNTGDQVFYSRIGDAYNMADSMLFHITGNSGGQVEKFNSAAKSWEKCEIIGLAYEGTKYVPIIPGNTYFYSALLSINTGENKVTGSFRIVLDYCPEKKPGDNTLFYRDYSNVFTIE
ncbi:MAG TPA: hypothetical protein PLP19_12270 [bacterium]|nr:hypothetical protein [bacterium]HPN44259.1 hypothetical protein [bacterium]